MPAGLCGIVGFKPTFGLLPRGGILAISESMDHHGPMTRTVADCAIVLGALTGPASQDPDPSRYLRGIKGGLKGLKIGVPEEFFTFPIDGEIARAIKTALGELRKLGAVVKKVSWPMLTYAQTISSAILAVDAAHALQELLFKNPRKIDSAVRNRIASGFFIPAARYLQAQQARAKLNHEGCRLLKEVDLLAGPTLGVPPPKIGEKEILVRGLKIGVSKALPPFVRPYNLTGFPAISIPCGFMKGRLPIGLQIAGRPFSEGTVLRAAYAYERANPWHKQHPSL